MSLHRILIVDDAGATHFLLKDMLEFLGHKLIAEASSGQEAITAYEQYKPTLVTLDLGLPDIHGLDVLKKLLEMDPGARIVIVTGDSRKTSEMEALKRGAKGVLHKPFMIEELEKTLNRVLADAAPEEA